MRGATPFAPLTSSHCGFQSTLLMRGATRRQRIRARQRSISIHAPHARSDPQVQILCKARFISIHAPHARSDRSRRRHQLPDDISIHAPHARSDTAGESVYQLSQFQSTLLMRGATYFQAESLLTTTAISIHAPHARSDSNRGRRHCRHDISIHAPHARSDMLFDEASAIYDISIHAPHARSDARSHQLLRHEEISIHAPHARSDFYVLATVIQRQNFNPRSSCEERPSVVYAYDKNFIISIHAPHARSDGKCLVEVFSFSRFQSTLLMRGATGRGGCKF